MPLMRFSAIPFLFAVTAAAWLSAAEANHLAAALEGINTEQLQAHVDVLADDSFEGREAGSRGGRATATYLMKQLQKYGLAGGGDRGSYFQSFGSGYRNVIAVLEGSDEKLKHQYIVVGAHFDHVGFGRGRNSYGPVGHIHNGADDNASGTAGLLELAESLAGLPTPPRRSVLIVFWDGEEKGLLGSKHWVEHPTIALEQVRCYINLDMIGRLRDDKVIIYGSRTAAGLRKLVSRANEPTQLRLSFVWWINPRSDHHTFYLRQIPVLMLHTDLHNDYHRPSDDAHKINAAGIRQTTRLLFNITYDLAQADALPPFRKSVLQERSAQRKTYERELPPLPPRLGVSWNDDDEVGLQLTRVAAGSAADAAGLQVGDRIVRFAGQEINNGKQLRAAVVAAPAETQVQVTRGDESAPRTLKLQLPGQPIRLGIAWRENDAEPGMVTIVRVVPDSPAAAAGIQRLDRVYQVSGRTFADSAQFQQLARTLTGPLELVIERDGRIQTVTVHPNDSP